RGRKYDRALVEGWKSDIEGMLIFVFLSTLTAFIIESYKTLIPYAEDSTVNLLTRILQQPSAAANGSTFTAPSPTVFIPPTTSLVCNTLWFISLGLSLICALIATLLEQWARDFLHRANMRSTPVTRARIFSYLYYGLKCFNMHTIVDIIPLLLHTSLVFFFAGLVAFLIPINLGIAAMSAASLVIVTAIYALLTVFPLWHPDCSYRTPLSGAFWRLSRSLMALWRRSRATVDALGTFNSSSMVETISHRAMVASSGRNAHDVRALVWTVKSLTDDSELEAFVEAFPDVSWGPQHRRHAYDDYVHTLQRSSDLQLSRLITNLPMICNSVASTLL
ncbi:hypothetical protein DFH09DRAFT_899035, partial [Mycena vulgaris]